MTLSSRIGPRLKAIYNLVAQVQQTTPYPLVWDCCCDHGYLGIKILSDHLCEKLVFVDQVPHIMAQLENRLAPLSHDKFELITADASELSFNADQRHLVILSGVGGECMVDIITSIESNHPDVEIDYIFCPSASQNALREYLVTTHFGLISESIACEKNRFYEIIFARGKPAENELPVVSLNNKMWQADNPDHQRYLDKLATHELKKRAAGKC